MTAQTTDLAEYFEYRQDGLGRDGYWVFAPFLEGDIELFQISMFAAGDSWLSLSSMVVADGRVRRLEVEGEERPAVLRDADRFRFGAEDLVTVSREPDGAYRVQTEDQANGWSADLRIVPAAVHPWALPGFHYTTTLEAQLDGTITIDGTAHEVSTICAFEHSMHTPVPAPNRAQSSFWQYEYVVWEPVDGERPHASIYWYALDQDQERIPGSIMVTSSPGGAHTEYDDDEVVHRDVVEREGMAVPTSWTVTATKGDETFRYHASVRTAVGPYTVSGGTASIVTMLSDCEGTHEGPDGTRTLRGVGRTEFLDRTYNPFAPAPATNAAQA